MVRLQLLEHLYEKLYMQRLHSSDEASWRCKIIPQRTVISASQSANSSVLLKLGAVGYGDSDQKLEELEVDYVFAATGYRRNAHEDMLAEVRDLLPEKNRIENKFPVARDYRVCYDGEKVDGEAGVWLQGCNEGTHGVSSRSLSPHLIPSHPIPQTKCQESKTLIIIDIAERYPPLYPGDPRRGARK